MRLSTTLVASLICCMAAADPKPNFDAAAAFGARPSVSFLRLSPDGKSVSYLAAAKGQGAIAYTLVLDGSAKPRPILSADGTPNRLGGCNWVANDRLICEVYGIVRRPDIQPFSHMIAVNSDGSNQKVLSTRGRDGRQVAGGYVVDWLPAQNGAVLLTRVKENDTQIGTRLGSDDYGLLVDLVDTRTLAATRVEPPTPKGWVYLSDGAGSVRVMGLANVRGATGQDAGTITYLFRRKGSRRWETLGTYDEDSREGFLPLAIDRGLDVVYGLKKSDGRMAVYTVALDGSMKETLVLARPDVDIDHLLTAGRQERVVGASYATDYRSNVYFDPAVDAVASALAKALKQRPALVDFSLDESRILAYASRDDDPGVYYLFDRPSKQLQTFLVVRSALEGVALAKVRPVTYPAADGTQIPGYLTLPPGRDNEKDLPAIVMPHGGPGARDEWGFDWLAQFYAARGFAVLQPNFRGSSGYGDTWFQKNGFQSWQVAIDDVRDAGRWLIDQHIAYPSKLAIVGWSYGGYAALQSAVTNPALFKAVVAIAPVTDLGAFKEEHRDWSNFYLVGRFVGDGPHVRDGSPALHASQIKAPVMLVHGTADVNVDIEQSRIMDRSLTAAGAKHEFMTFDGLDHQLDDSDARTTLLRRSDAFLRQALGL